MAGKPRLTDRCGRGHDLTVDGFYHDPKGQRFCRKCRQDARDRYNATHPYVPRKKRSQEVEDVGR
jgi:hypothetical protein